MRVIVIRKIGHGLPVVTDLRHAASFLSVSMKVLSKHLQARGYYETDHFIAYTPQEDN
jgi:hypothetical protein